jgi:hypothetical protein
MAQLLITVEDVERTRARIAAKNEHSPVERTPASPVLKARRQAKGLEYPLPAGPLPVIMEDDFIHTISFPCCNDADCCCYQHERAAIIAETTPKRKPRRRSYAVNCEPARPRDDRHTFQLMR